MKKLVIITSLALLTGCLTNQYDDRRAAIEADYAAGKMSAADYHNLMMQVDSQQRTALLDLANDLEANSAGSERAMYNSLPPGSQKRMRKYMQDPPKEYEIIDSRTGRSTGYSLEEK